MSPICSIALNLSLGLDFILKSFQNGLYNGVIGWNVIWKDGRGMVGCLVAECLAKGEIGRCPLKQWPCEGGCMELYRAHIRVL